MTFPKHLFLNIHSIAGEMCNIKGLLPWIILTMYSVLTISQVTELSASQASNLTLTTTLWGRYYVHFSGEETNVSDQSKFTQLEMVDLAWPQSLLYNKATIPPTRKTKVCILKLMVGTQWWNYYDLYWKMIMIF